MSKALACVRAPLHLHKFWTSIRDRGKDEKIYCLVLKRKRLTEIMRKRKKMERQQLQTFSVVCFAAERYSKRVVNSGSVGIGGDVAQLVDHWTGTPPRQVRFPGAARDFSPRVSFQCRLSYGVRTPPCANRMPLHLCAR